MLLGVLGGTFDPVHVGHLILADEARAALGLTRVLLVPAAQPWRKADRAVTPAAHRLAMLRAAVAGDPWLAVSAVEIERGGPTYTVDTLAELRAELAAGDELVFILGEDALLDLPHWRDPAGILHLARLAVAARPRAADDTALADTIRRLEPTLPGLGGRVAVVPMPRIGLSSTDIRRRVAEGRPVRFMLPPPALAYVEAHGLYRV